MGFIFGVMVGLVGGLYLCNSYSEQITTLIEYSKGLVQRVRVLIGRG